MMARRLSRVAARTLAGSDCGPARSAIFAPSLASTAGHMPSSADNQSGRGAGAVLWVQGGSAAAALASSGLSCSEAKKARQEGSTEFGSVAHFAYSASTKSALPP